MTKKSKTILHTARLRPRRCEAVHYRRRACGANQGILFQDTAALTLKLAVRAAASVSPFCEPRNDGREVVIPPNPLLLS